MMNIAAVFAQLERETIAERVKDNMYMLAKTGRWLGGTTPFLFDSEKADYINDKGVSRKCCKLIENYAQLETVKLIYKKFRELLSMNKLETYLLNRKITTQNDCRFYVTTIRNILTNPVYCTADLFAYDYFNIQGCDIAASREECNGSRGFIGYSKTETSRGGERVINNRNDWIIAIGKHKGIISGEEWVEVQGILEENADSKIKYKQSHNPTALLSGILLQFLHFPELKQSRSQIPLFSTRRASRSFTGRTEHNFPMIGFISAWRIQTVYFNKHKGGSEWIMLKVHKL